MQKGHLGIGQIIRHRVKSEHVINGVIVNVITSHNLRYKDQCSFFVKECTCILLCIRKRDDKVAYLQT